MFMLPTHQCSERPGRTRRWLLLAAFAVAFPGLDNRPVAAQVAVGRVTSCPGGASMVGDLGVDFQCQDCELSYHASSRSWRWRFRSEPTIEHVGASGPSRGKLRSGDVIVSIDGRLITTRSGGVRLATLRPGRQVLVEVRRNGREMTTEITPAAACPTDVSPVGPLPPVPPVAGVLRPTRPSVLLEPGRGVSGVLAPLPPSMSGARAWFGFGLSCSNCKFYPVRHEEIAAAEAQLKARSQGDNIDPEETAALYRDMEAYRAEGSRWEFTENPRVFSVDEDGPADRAGLRRGDVLTHIDGLALLSDEGGKRLGQVRPGDEAEFVYRRGTTVGTATLTASRGPVARGIASDHAIRSYQALLERSLSRIESTTDPAVRAEIARLQAQLREAERVQRVASVEAHRSERVQTRPLRYSGSIAKVNVTVRSHASVVVSRDEKTGEVVITTSDATIRVKPED